MSGQSATKSVSEVKATIKKIEKNSNSAKSGGTEMNKQTGNKSIGKC